MADTVLAKVDYLKPLEDKPYSQVVSERQNFSAQQKASLDALLGPEQVCADTASLDALSRDKSLEEAGRPCFILKPENLEKLCALVKYANEASLPLTPLSSGTHTYGNSLVRMGGAAVDLSDWRQIQKIDHRNRSARIQPGVTYGQLQEALAKENLRALFPLLPRKDQSVLTSNLEAQPKLIPEFNFSEPVYTMEIVMPTGDVFRTGTAALGPPELNQSDMVGPWGPGFDWNRLYTRSQGTLGIVTWMNIMAEPLPSRQKLFFTASDNLEALVDFTYRVQRKWLGYECFILNRTALALMLAQSMPDDYERLKKRLPAYVQIFCIGGLRRLPDERIAWQEADFLETARECGLAPQPGISQAPRAAAFFQTNLLRCWDGDVYWKDRLKGSSSDIFFITTMNRAPLFVDAMHREALQGTVGTDDMGIYLQPIENGRVCHLEFMLPYDPADRDDCARMRQAHIRASRRMYDLGALFTRAYGPWAELTASGNALQFQTAKMVKDVLDPKNIMNPGKLGL
jgi:FAD/FMN-containing dehydrogenase